MSFNPKIIAVIAAAAAAGVALFLARPRGEPADVHITAEGAEYAVVPLDEDRTINIPGPAGTTTVEVRDGRVRVLDSPCPNKICVSQGWVRRPGDTIVCLPNRVLVTVK